MLNWNKMFTKTIVVVMTFLMLALMLVFGIQHQRLTALLYTDDSLASKFGQMCKAEQGIPQNETLSHDDANHCPKAKQYMADAITNASRQILSRLSESAHEDK
ncbi:MAG: hypothetical protein WA395_10795 [Nitrososphaeraceae archaeon]